MAQKVAFFLPGDRGGAIDRAQDTVKETTLPALQCYPSLQQKQQI
jgi:hypothetical protein